MGPQLTPTDRHDSPLPAHRRVSTRRWILGAAIVMVCWLAGPRVLQFAAPGYEATLRLKIDSDRGGSVQAFDGIEVTRVDSAVMQTLCGIIGSERVLRPVADRLSLRGRWSEPGRTLTDDQVTRRLRSAVTAHGGRESSLLEVSVTDTDPRAAAEIANAIGEVFRADRERVRQEKAAAEVANLRAAVEEQERRMVAAQAKAARLGRGLAGAETGGRDAADALRHIAADLMRTRLEWIEKNARIDALRDVAARRRYDAVGTLVNDAILAGQLQKLADMDLWLSVLQDRYGAGYPRLQGARAERELMTERIDHRLAGVIAAAAIEADLIQARADRLQSQLDDARAGGGGGHGIDDAQAIALRNARRDEDLETKLYEALCERLQKTVIQARIPGRAVEVLDRAQVPEDPIGGGQFEAQSFALIAGLLIAGLVIVVLESLDTSLRGVTEVEQHLRLPVVGLLPRGMAPLTGESAKARHVEAYRVLRNNLEFSRVDGPVRSLCVVSAGPGEGKSLTVANLACTYAHAGARVLVVDTDLRRPTAHQIFGVANGAGGFAEVLEGSRTLDEAVQRTAIPNLSVLASGGENQHGSLIESPAMARLVAAAASRFDVVLYDTPSTLAVSDATIVAREVGLTLMVVREGKYSRNAVRRARNTLSNAGTHLIGVALNDVSARRDLACAGYQNDSVSFRAARAKAEQSRIAPPKARSIAA